MALIGTWDLIQTPHSVLRNYPVLAHMRFLFEDIRPALRQYSFESNLSGTPSSREQRTLIDKRAKAPNRRISNTTQQLNDALEE